jgi:hypothetical protein
MYKVMLSVYGLPTVVSTNSSEYAAMCLTHNYTEYFSGTKKECEIEAEELIADFADMD